MSFGMEWLIKFIVYVSGKTTYFITTLPICANIHKPELKACQNSDRSDVVQTSDNFKKPYHVRNDACNQAHAYVSNSNIRPQKGCRAERRVFAADFLNNCHPTEIIFAKWVMSCWHAVFMALQNCRRAYMKYFMKI